MGGNRPQFWHFRCRIKRGRVHSISYGRNLQRIVSLRTVVEVSPNSNLRGAFEEDEILYLKAEGSKKRLEMKVVKDAVYLIAKLGGFTCSYKRPGWQILWQGWIKFYERVEGFKLAKEIYSL